MIYSNPKVEQEVVTNSLVLVFLGKFMRVASLCIASLLFLTSYSPLAISSSKPEPDNSFEYQPIILVSSSALSGPAAKLGLRLNQGSQAYFSKIKCVHFSNSIVYWQTSITHKSHVPHFWKVICNYNRSNISSCTFTIRNLLYSRYGI